jgi:hypothetical protein
VGGNAYTTIASNFNNGALGGNATIPLADSRWCVPGQCIVVNDGTTDGATYLIVSVVSGTPGTVLATYLNYSTNTNAAGLVTAGAGVSPGGLQSALLNPLPIAYGGTGQTTRVLAQTALGVGQTPLVSTVAGLTQNITQSYVQIGGCQVTIPVVGTWLDLATAQISFANVTYFTPNNSTITLAQTSHANHWVQYGYWSGLYSSWMWA